MLQGEFTQNAPAADDEAQTGEEFGGKIPPKNEFPEICAQKNW